MSGRWQYNNYSVSNYSHTYTPMDIFDKAHDPQIEVNCYIPTSLVEEEEQQQQKHRQQHYKQHKQYHNSKVQSSVHVPARVSTPSQRSEKKERSRKACDSCSIRKVKVSKSLFLLHTLRLGGECMLYS